MQKQNSRHSFRTSAAQHGEAYLAFTYSGVNDVPRVVLYKLILHPALVFGVGKLAQRAGVPLGDFSVTVLALVAALPSASNVPMLAERFGADTARVASIVLLTTAGAFLTFSAAVALLV